MKTNIRLLSMLCLLGYGAMATEFSQKTLKTTAYTMYGQNYDSLTEDKQKKVIKGLEKKHAVLQLAQMSNISKTQAYQDALSKASKGILINMYLAHKKEAITVSPEEIENAYNKHLRDYTNVYAFTLVRKHEKDLEKYISILEKTPSEKIENVFRTLAKEHSEHPLKSKGGEMGFIGYDSIVQPFGKEAFRLRENTFTHKAVKTVLGYHLIYIKARKVLSLNKVQKAIKETLKNTKYKAWFKTIE